MNGTRVTSEDKSVISTYIGLIVATMLIVGAIYFFFFARTKMAEVTGFDPNRPVPSDALLHKRLKPNQYHVTRENGTETAFQNDYWNNERVGIYVDVITGEPLFASIDKYDAGNGRPTFRKPISKDALVEKLDKSFDMERTEVRARRSDAHLGHVFPDSTSPTGQRYAINSAAVRFIPREAMSEEGYSAYRSILDQPK